MIFWGGVKGDSLEFKIHNRIIQSGRATYVAADDKDTLEAFQLLCETEGIVPALEPAHAISYASKMAGSLNKEQILVVNLSGHGDKDMGIIVKALGVKL